jgi:uncharacterized protein
MDLHPTGSKKLLEITIDKEVVLSLYGEHESLDPLFQYGSDKEENLCTLALRTAQPRDIQISLLEEHDGVLEMVDRSSSLVYVNGQYLLKQLKPFLFEEKDYSLYLEVISDSPRETFALHHESQEIDSKINPIGEKTKLSGASFNFGSSVGFSCFHILKKEFPFIDLILEVYPSKINYKDDYQALMADINRELYGLIYDYLKKSYSTYDLGYAGQQTPLEFFAVIKTVFRQYLNALDKIIREPYHELQPTHMIRKGFQSGLIDNGTIKWFASHPNELVKNGGGEISAVLRYNALKKTVTYDTKENRMTKFMLARTISRLLSFKNRFLASISKQDDDVVRNFICELDSMIGNLRRRYYTSFLSKIESKFSDVSTSSVFQMAPGYREFHRYDIMLYKGLNIQGGPFGIQLKDLATIYEYWCFIKLNALVRSNSDYELAKNGMLVPTLDDGLHITLAKGEKAEMVYRRKDDKSIKVSLFYNKEYVGGKVTHTVTQKPDNVLTINKANGNNSLVYSYVFDAKYRIDMAESGSRYKQLYSTPGPVEDTINTMHRYRDSIIYSGSKTEKYDRGMFGAYVLFPYSNEEEYKNHRFYKSIDEVNIGGFPFLPSHTVLVTNFVNELLRESPISAYSRAIGNGEAPETGAAVDWTHPDVVIGGVPSPDRFRFYYSNGVYWMPEAQIRPDSLPIRYVALYQSVKEFGNESGVHYYGEILTISLKQRSEIPLSKEAAPSSLKSKYWYMRVKWHKLNNDIKVSDHAPSNVISRFGVAPLTNMFVLSQASTYPELEIKNEQEYRLMYEIKRYVNGWFIDDKDLDEIHFDYNQKSVYIKDESIYVDNKATCSLMDFKERPSKMFDDIWSEINYHVNQK